MKLATLHDAGTTTAAVAVAEGYAVIDGVADVGDLLRDPDWRAVAERTAAAAGRVVPAEEAAPAQLVTRPGKVVCVGLNYKSHILEMGRDLPSYPTLFAKFAQTLTGPYDDVVAVAEDPELDWEGELVVVIGSSARGVSEAEAESHIAGYTIANDVSMRAWQFRTKEWLQGKIWEGSTPLGPVLSTPDEVDLAGARLVTTVNGAVMQDHSIGDLLFTPAHLVSYVSTMITLDPGDVILTGTPGGVGRAREPQVFLRPGDVVSVEIDGIGQISSRVVEPS